MARTSKSTKSDPTTDPTTDATEATEATTPEPTEEPTEATTTDATDATDDATETDPKVTAHDAWNRALDAADTDGVVPADVTAELVNAYNALPGRVAPAEFRAKVQADTVARAMVEPTDPDRRILTAMGSLLSTLSAADAAPATAPVDPVAPWADKVRALAVLADEVRRAIPDDAYGSGTVRTAVEEILGDDLARAFGTLADQRPADANLEAAWRASSFGGRIPDPARISGSSASRSTVGRNLSNVADGPVTYAHRGTTHTAEVRGGKIVTADGTEHGSPTGAATHVNGGTSVNGWTAWERDGVNLADVHDA